MFSTLCGLAFVALLNPLFGDVAPGFSLASKAKFDQIHIGTSQATLNALLGEPNRQIEFFGNVGRPWADLVWKNSKAVAYVTLGQDWLVVEATYHDNSANPPQIYSVRSTNGLCNPCSGRCKTAFTNSPESKSNGPPRLTKATFDQIRIGMDTATANTILGCEPNNVADEWPLCFFCNDSLWCNEHIWISTNAFNGKITGAMFTDWQRQPPETYEIKLAVSTDTLAVSTLGDSKGFASMFDSFDSPTIGRTIQPCVTKDCTHDLAIWFQRTAIDKQALDAVSRKTCDRIRAGMTYKEVEAIIRKPFDDTHLYVPDHGDYYCGPLIIQQMFYWYGQGCEIRVACWGNGEHVVEVDFDCYSLPPPRTCERSLSPLSSFPYRRFLDCLPNK